MAPLEVEDVLRAVIRVKTDAPAAAAGVESELGAVVIGLLRRNDRRIGKLTFGDTPKRVAYEGLPARQLGLGIQVLQLTATAIVAYVVWTARLNPVERRFQDLEETTPAEPLVRPDFGGFDEISGSSPRNEDGFSIQLLSNPVATSGDTKNADSAHRSASVRASRLQLSL
jgi:hypothetical protein